MSSQNKEKKQGLKMEIGNMKRDIGEDPEGSLKRVEWILAELYDNQTALEQRVAKLEKDHLTPDKFMNALSNFLKTKK